MTAGHPDVAGPAQPPAASTTPPSSRSVHSVDGQILTYPQELVPASLRDQVFALQDREWPRQPGRPPGHDPALTPVMMLMVCGGQVVASLDLLSTRNSHAGHRFSASGVRAVVTDPRERGRGHGRRVVSAALGYLRGRGDDLGIFTCDPRLVPFYVGAGWSVRPGTWLVGGTRQTPLRSDDLGMVTLGAFFTGHARRHADAFTGCAVEIYPGEIDRLW